MTRVPRPTTLHPSQIRIWALSWRYYRWQYVKCLRRNPLFSLLKLGRRRASRRSYIATLYTTPTARFFFFSISAQVLNKSDEPKQLYRFYRGSFFSKPPRGCACYNAQVSCHEYQFTRRASSSLAATWPQPPKHTFAWFRSLS